MRTTAIMLAAALTVAAAPSRQRYVMPTEQRVGIYGNRIRKPYDQALYRVGPADRLVVLEETGGYLKVRDDRGRAGWVEKRLVATVSASSLMTFRDARVRGYLGNPGPIYIMDIDHRDPVPIRVDRSFAEELAVNLDRETVERIAR